LGLPLSPLTDLDVADAALEVLVSFLDVVDSPLETFLDVTILAPHFLNLYLTYVMSPYIIIYSIYTMSPLNLTLQLQTSSNLYLGRVLVKLVL